MAMQSEYYNGINLFLVLISTGTHLRAEMVRKYANREIHDTSALTFR